MYLPLQYQAPKGSVFPLSVTQEDLRESLSPHRFFGVEDIYALWERTPEGSFNRVEGFRSTDDIDIHLKELQTEGAIPTLDFVGFRKKSSHLGEGHRCGGPSKGSPLCSHTCTAAGCCSGVFEDARYQLPPGTAHRGSLCSGGTS